MLFGTLIKNNDGIYVPITENDSKRLFIKRQMIFNHGSDDTLSLVEPESDDSFFKEFNDKIIEAAKEHRQDWWGKSVHDSTIEKAFYSSYNFDTHSLEVSTFEKTKMFNSSREEVDLYDFTGDVMCNVVLEPNCIRFYRRHFEVDWKLVQLMALPPPKPILEEYPEHCMFED